MSLFRVRGLLGHARQRGATPRDDNSATPCEHGSMDAALHSFLPVACSSYVLEQTRFHGSIGENSADVVCGTFFHLMETAGRTPISKLLVLDYTALAFVTTTRQPVAGEAGCLIFPLILSTPEREATIVEATRTSVNATKLKSEVASYRLM